MIVARLVPSLAHGYASSNSPRNSLHRDLDVTRFVLLATALALPSTAWACGGTKTASAADSDQAEKTVESALADADPSHCAKKSALVGSSCSFATGMMAQRVLEEGEPYTYMGTLASSSNALDSRVAAPYTMGPDRRIHVIANEVLDALVDVGSEADRLELVGHLLEVDGQRYFVATTFQPLNT